MFNDTDIRGVNIVKDLGWLNIKQRMDYFVGLPAYITDKFTMISEIVCRSTRSTTNKKNCLPKANKAIYTSSLEHSSPLVWNQLPSSILYVFV